MNLNRSSIASKEKDLRGFDSSKDYPTIEDLMREQKVSGHEASSVHHRRDLDSLG